MDERRPAVPMRAMLTLSLSAVLCLSTAPVIAAAVELHDTEFSSDSQSREVASTVWFQGFVQDPGTGEPVNATHDIVAEVFDTLEGGSSLWGPETHAAVSIVDGWFNIELGSTAVLPGFDAPPYFLELTVNGEVLAPRMKLASVPSAFRAQVAEEDDGDWSISGDNLHRMTGNVGIGTETPTERFEVYASHDTSIRGKSSGDAGSFYGVVGEGWGDGTVRGVLGYGYGTGSVYGVEGIGDGTGVYGRNNQTNTYGHLGAETAGVLGGGGETGAWGGYFIGNTYVSDTLGVGTLTPQARLDVNGTVRMTGFEMPDGAVAGRMLTSDGTGVGTWQDAPGGDYSFWLPSGSDIYLDAPGRVGIGTQSPDARLDIVARQYEQDAVKATNNNPGEVAYGVSVETIGSESRAVYGNAYAPLGTAYALYGEARCNGGTVHGVFSDARTDTGTAYGVKATASSGYTMADHSIGVYGKATVPSISSYGVQGVGGTWGVEGKHFTTNATGSLGGGLAGVYGDDGGGAADWAGYFVGDVFFDDALGVGTEAPRRPIHVYTDYAGAVSYAIEVENYAGALNSATGILFKIDSSNEDRGKGGIVYEWADTWNRGDFHILQDNGANPNVADLADAALTVTNSRNVGIGTTTPASKLEVAGIVHSTTGGFKFPDGSIQTSASPVPNRAAGNVVLDVSGEAVVELPASLRASELRYQLTCIGGFAPVYVAEKAAGGIFAIAGGEPGMEVSWQVTGE
jgi:hypothetical protein